MTNLTVELRPDQRPLDFGQIVERFRNVSIQRRDALRDWERAIHAAAQAEAEYRKAYAIAIVKAEGTAAVREALARAEVVELSAKRDVTRDMKDVCKERVRGLEGERANLNGLADWSKRLDHGIGG